MQHHLAQGNRLPQGAHFLTAEPTGSSSLVPTLNDTGADTTTQRNA